MDIPLYSLKWGFNHQDRVHQVYKSIRVGYAEVGWKYIFDFIEDEYGNPMSFSKETSIVIEMIIPEGEIIEVRALEYDYNWSDGNSKPFFIEFIGTGVKKEYQFTFKEFDNKPWAANAFNYSQIMGLDIMRHQLASSMGAVMSNPSTWDFSIYKMCLGVSCP